jgi:hypothetical protein
MISKTKTYDLNSQKYNLLDRILEKNNSIHNHNIFLITDDEETKKYISDNSISKLTILNQSEAQNVLDSDKNSILVLDINDKLVNSTKLTTDVNILIFKLL